MIRLLRPLIACSALACFVTPAIAQISFTSAVGLALKSSPKVLAAQADVTKAQAALDELRDAYVPNVVGASSIGPPSYGFPLGQPSIYNLTSQSLVFSYPQRDYIRGAKASLEAASLVLKDVRESVAEDTAITYLALDRDLQRQSSPSTRRGPLRRPASPPSSRTASTPARTAPIDLLTTSRLTGAQIRLARLHDEDEAPTPTSAHLARLTWPTRARASPPLTSQPPPAHLGEARTCKSAGIAATLIGAGIAVESAYANAQFQEPPDRLRRLPLRVAPPGRLLDARSTTASPPTTTYSTTTTVIFSRTTPRSASRSLSPSSTYAHRAKARQSAAEAVHALREADLQPRPVPRRPASELKHAAAELAARNRSRQPRPAARTAAARSPCIVQLQHRHRQLLAGTPDVPQGRADRPHRRAR